jgi:hypothetical protein
MNIRSLKKLEKICILNDNQRESKLRPVTVFGITKEGGYKDFVTDSLLKALVIAAIESDNSQVFGMLKTDVESLSDSELIQIFPFHFSSWFIGLSSLAVWNYN